MANFEGGQRQGSQRSEEDMYAERLMAGKVVSGVNTGGVGPVVATIIGGCVEKSIFSAPVC